MTYKMLRCREGKVEGMGPADGLKVRQQCLNLRLHPSPVFNVSACHNAGFGVNGCFIALSVPLIELCTAQL